MKLSDEAEIEGVGVTGRSQRRERRRSMIDREERTFGEQKKGTGRFQPHWVLNQKTKRLSKQLALLDNLWWLMELPVQKQLE